jgi:radical SAM protein with 4Fe4S-binding SPASM domain
MKTQAFKEKFQLLKKYNLHFGILMVATKQNIKSIQKSFKFLRKKYGIESLKINYVEDVNSEGSGTNEITGKEYVKYVIEPAIKSYIKDGYFQESNTSRLIERVFYENLAIINHFERSSCYSKFCGAGQTIIEIEPTGKVFMCGRYSEEFDESYIMKSDDYDMFGINQLQKHYNFQLEKTKHINDLKCDTCRADYLCDHGCMAFHLSKYNKWGIRNELVCDIFISVEKIMMDNLEKLLISHIRKEYKKNGCNKNSEIKFGMKFGDAIKIREGRALQYLKNEQFKVSINKPKNNPASLIVTVPKKYIKKWSK